MLENEKDETVSEAGTGGSRLAEDLKARGKGLLNAAKEKVTRRADEIKNKSLGELGTDVREYVRNNPGTVILVSFLAGLVIGSVVRGRDRRDG